MNNNNFLYFLKKNNNKMNEILEILIKQILCHFIILYI